MLAAIRNPPVFSSETWAVIVGAFLTALNVAAVNLAMGHWFTDRSKRQQPTPTEEKKP